MTAMNDHELIYDWNSVEKVAPLSPKRRHPVPRRDACATASSRRRWSIPSIDDKLRLVELANDLGIDTMDIGLPGAGKRAVEDVTTHRRAHPRRASCAIKAVVRRAHARQHDIQADRRDLAEGRHRDRGAGASSAARRSASTPRTGTCRRMLQALRRGDRPRRVRRPAGHLRHRGHDALAPRGPRRRCSATPSSTARTRLCLCDTVGHATPDGIRTCSSFTAQPARRHGRADVGHRLARPQRPRPRRDQRDLRARVRRRPRARHRARHRRARRQRRARPDPVNLKLLGELPRARPHQARCCSARRSSAGDARADPPATTRSSARRVPHRHRRARRRDHQGREEGRRAGSPTASTPACRPGMFGKEQEIEIGHDSGESNVVYWLKKRGYEPTQELVAAVLGDGQARQSRARRRRGRRGDQEHRSV